MIAVRARKTLLVVCRKIRNEQHTRFAKIAYAIALSPKKLSLALANNTRTSPDICAAATSCRARRQTKKKLKLHIRPERANRYECSAENWGLPDECGGELEVFVKVV